MKKVLTIGCLSTLLFMFSGCVSQQSIHVKSKHQVSPYASVSLNFSAHDRSRIKGYYLYNHRKIPPGQLKKYKRNYKRNHVLPKHIKYSHLPYSLERQLLRLPRDYVRVQIGNDIAIMNSRTRVIYDIIWLLE